MGKFKLGIIGCGRIVEVGHSKALKALADEVEVVALADPSEERLKTIGNDLGVDAKNRFKDYKDMLRKVRLDFVDIALPHFLHVEAIEEAARAKVNIISEKPLATNLEEVERIEEAIERNGVQLGVLHNYIYIPQYRRAIELIEEGAIGKPFLIRSEGLGGGHWPGTPSYDPDWRTKRTKSGGGCLLDNGYHNVYLARAMMRSPVKYVYAQIGTFVQPIDVDDLAVVLFKHENGGTSSIQVGWAVKGGGARVNEVHGTKGSISFDKKENPLALYDNERGGWEYPQVCGDENSFTGIMGDILRAVRGGKPVPAGVQEARKNLEIVMAAYESARRGDVVEVD
ncbi:MAG: Gfo/Idh/MocA family protein [bacterium]